MDRNISLTEEELGIIKYGGVVTLLSSDGTTVKIQLEKNATCGLVENIPDGVYIANKKDLSLKKRISSVEKETEE